MAMLWSVRAHQSEVFVRVARNSMATVRSPLKRLDALK